MTSARDLADYERDYGASRFEKVQARYRKRMLLELLNRVAPRSVLEVGCGLDTIANHWRGAERFVVVEPAAGFAEQARQDGATVVEATLDTAALEGPFDLILLSGLLHELDDCGPTLDAARNLCGPETIVHVNVPNANSFHRLLAVEMGLIPRPETISALQQKLQQRRTFTRDSLAALLSQHGLIGFEEGSYFVKPFTHAQMQQLRDDGLMTDAVLDGLWNMTAHLPGLGSEIFINARPAAAGAA